VPIKAMQMYYILLILGILLHKNRPVFESFTPIYIIYERVAKGRYIFSCVYLKDCRFFL
jgi:hypothetical protein